MADRFPLIIDNSEEKIKELVSGDNLDLTKSNLKNADYIQSAGVNVAGVATATSLIGDGSQLTNLPPSGGSLEATASGTLADGSTVIVNTDGTVSVVAQTETTGPGVGSASVYESDNTQYSSAIYDSSNNKVVIAYSDYGNNYAGTAVVGTVSGTSISFGSVVTFAANTTHTSAVYDPDTQKIVIAYRDGNNSGYGTAVVGTVSGTSISFGSSAVFNSNGSTTYISPTYDSTNQKVVFAYTDVGNNYYGTAVVGTVSGTSISFGSPAVFNSNTVYYSSITYDPSNQKVVISYRNGGNSWYGTAIVGTVSGTSISFGTPVTFESAASSWFSSVYDPNNQKVVITYNDNGNNYYGTAIVGTVSGTSISFGSPTVFASSGIVTPAPVYDPDTQKIVIAYRDSDSSPQYGKLVVGTVSGTSISFGSSIIFNSATSLYISATYDSSNDKVVIACTDYDNSQYGTAFVYGQTGFPVPSLGSPKVFETGATYYCSAVYDPNNQKVVIAYQDQGNSWPNWYGTAIVGTVSGTSITFGTPVVFESAVTSFISATFDSSNNKVVIAYRDDGNSDYGKVVVGTVSGTSITFGTPVVFESAVTSYISATFDSSNNKVVIAYRDEGNNNGGTAIVGTVSGNSISFGTPGEFNPNQNTNYITATFDSTNNKVVIAYSNAGNNYYGTAVVGTVSGTSISFGNHTVFRSAYSDSISTTYDPNNQKVVVVYRDVGNSDYGTASVGEVDPSNNTISFGTPVVYNSARSDPMSLTYDTTNQKVVLAYLNNQSDGKVVIGTVSGTSISFESPTVFESGTARDISAIYDSNTQKTVIAYRNTSNSHYGTAVVFSPVTIVTNLTSENFIGISNGAYSDGQTATIQIMGAVDDAQSSLTPGQAYYVQDDGTLAESGSVFAGTAIAATKLIVRG